MGKKLFDVPLDILQNEIFRCTVVEKITPKLQELTRRLNLALYSDDFAMLTDTIIYELHEHIKETITTEHKKTKTDETKFYRRAKSWWNMAAQNAFGKKQQLLMIPDRTHNEKSESSKKELEKNKERNEGRPAQTRRYEKILA